MLSSDVQQKERLMISTKTARKAVLKLGQADDSHKQQSAPPPVGSYPYRLEVCKNKSSADNMVFHLAGDTGGTRSAEMQHKIAAELTAQAKEAHADFMYHLGDIVYHYGEQEGYEAQFLAPFAQYPAPIYAIAGNHDTDINPETWEQESLGAFYTAFCSTTPTTIHFAPQTRRKSQVQPNVYWTMISPLAIVIGLHTNVPKYGYVDPVQKSWFIDELKNAAACHQNKAIIVCLHHAPYSADVNHGSSVAMIELLDDAFKASGVRPDVVFSGHVHNYQRFTKQYPDGGTVPFIVAGAGGFDELHALASPEDEGYEASHDLFKGLSLEKYCDDRHGFLKVSLKRTPFGLQMKIGYYTVPADSGIYGAALFDEHHIDLSGR